VNHVQNQGVFAERPSDGTAVNAQRLSGDCPGAGRLPPFIVRSLTIGGMHIQNLDVPVCIVHPVGERIVTHDCDL